MYVCVQVKAHVKTQKKMGISKASGAGLEEISLADTIDLGLAASTTIRRLILIS